MARKKLKPQAINQYIMHTIKNEKPETVEQLIKQVQSKYPIPKREITEHVLYLHKRGKLLLKERLVPLPSTQKSFFLSTKRSWYWIIVALALATTTTMFTIPEGTKPLVYTRYALGSLFVLFLPGHTFMKALFPKKELSSLEMLTLSVGVSLTIVSIIGLFLNYTPWGIKEIPMTLVLFAFTIISATIALIREYQVRLEENSQ